VKIVITVSRRSCSAAALAALATAAAQLPGGHGGINDAVMVMAGIACGWLMSSRPGTPAA